MEINLPQNQIKEEYEAPKLIRDASGQLALSNDIKHQRKKIWLPVQSLLKNPLLKLARLRYVVAKLFKWRKPYVLSLGAIGIVVLTGFVFKNPLLKLKNSDVQKVPAASSNGTLVKAPFSAVLPAGNISDTSSNNLKYSEPKKTASFTDSIAGVPITVSEQQLPDRFKTDQINQLNSFAKEIYANEELSTGSLKSYLGTSVRGAQTAVLIKNNLLIFIFSTQNIQKTDWQNYIISLK